MPFELVFKPTFTNQLIGLPAEAMKQVVSKVEQLRADPLPDGTHKKKIKGFKADIYRIRAGHYRILYALGPGLVQVLAVERRDKVYEHEPVAPIALAFAGSDIAPIDLEPVEDDRLVYAVHRQPADAAAPPADEPLPRPIETDLLTRLRIEQRYHAALVACASVDDLIRAAVPDRVRDVVFDCVMEPDIERVLQQPSLDGGEPDDLLRYAEGELLALLLKLSTEQQQLVNWAMNASGPTLVKGGPGTGKSTVALYRVRALIAALRKAGIARPSILLTTYTNALVRASEQQLQRLLGEDVALVDVRTADSVAMRLIRAEGEPPRIASDDEVEKILRAATAAPTFSGNALQQRAMQLAVGRLSTPYLRAEIEELIVARGLNTIEEYLGARRNGRQVPLNTMARMAVWRVYEGIEIELAQRKTTTWARLRRQAAQLAKRPQNRGRYDGVVIDEAQDLDPTALRMLIALCAAPNRLFVTADANQSIYGSGFRWTDVDDALNFRGRTAVLRRNYRSTAEIGLAAENYLRHGALEDSERPSEYVLSGEALPVVRVVANEPQEAHLLVRFITEATRKNRVGVGACAVLVPREAAGHEIARRLRQASIPAAFMRSVDLDLARPEVKVLTLQGAKGLEFPAVAIAGLAGSQFATPPASDKSEETDEALRRDRRTMFVAMTRAMRALLVLVPANAASPLLEGFEPALWNLPAGDLSLPKPAPANTE